jgi:hypothetical protein
MTPEEIAQVQAIAAEGTREYEAGMAALRERFPEAFPEATAAAEQARTDEERRTAATEAQEAVAKKDFGAFLSAKRRTLPASKGDPQKRSWPSPT